MFESTPIAAAYRGVSKSFGVTQALRDISFDVQEGTIHALLGENGAGKSTALGVLAGRLAPTTGSVELFGETLPAMQPRRARQAGLAAIYQELTIVPELSAEANVFVGQALARAGVLAQRRMRSEYERLCERLGVAPVPSGVPAGRLSVADQQLLEIMRALAFDARMILFDEPTASLGIAERRAFLDLMRSLRESGTTMVFVSHNLDEVLDVADTITVFRSGRHVLTASRSEMTKHDVVRSMLGDTKDLRLLRTLEDPEADVAQVAPAERPRRDSVRDSVVLRAEGVTLPGAIEGIGLELHEGEIVGLGGLVGSGRTSVLRALAGLEPASSGRLWIDGREVVWPRSVRRARTYGIALAPEDRKGQGLALDQDAALNVAMADLASVSRVGWVSRPRLEAAAREAATPFGFDGGRIREVAGRLSGGNQQKLLLARWHHCPPKVLLADEPTRGIDIAAKEDVLTALEAMAERGLAIVVVSSELEELVIVSDRVEVLAEGRHVGRLEREEGDITVSRILDAAFAVGGPA
jgi:ABC-type sugar transport system ATPase subunit